MDSIIETQRQTHEELERYEAALAEVLMQNPTVVSTTSISDTKSAEEVAKKYNPSRPKGSGPLESNRTAQERSTESI